MPSSFTTARRLDPRQQPASGDGPQVGPRGSRGRAFALRLTCLPLHAAGCWIALPGSNLNDPHLSWISGTWLLTTAEAVNDAGVIVGNGTFGGSRGWVLVPQPVAAPAFSGWCSGPDHELVAPRNRWRCATTDFADVRSPGFSRLGCL